MGIRIKSLIRKTLRKKKTRIIRELYVYPELKVWHNHDKSNAIAIFEDGTIASSLSFPEMKFNCLNLPIEKFCLIMFHKETRFYKNN